MAHTIWRRRPRCAYLGCKNTGTDHLHSRVLGIDNLFCPEHTITLLHLYKRTITYVPVPPPAPRRRRHGAHSAR